MGFCLIHTGILQGWGACEWQRGRRHRGELPANDVDYFVSCLMPKPEARVLCFKRIKTERCRRRSGGLRGVCALGMCALKSCLLLPTGHCLPLELLPNSGSRAPKSALHPPERAGRLKGQGQPCGPPGPPASCLWEPIQWAGKGGEAWLLPVPYWGRMSPATSPLLSPFTSLKARLVILIIKP